MTAADEEPPAGLRIGGWLPPAEQAEGTAGPDTTPTGDPAEAHLPAVRGPVPSPYPSAWIPPSPPPLLGERPAHRAGPVAVRSRSLLLIALAAAAAVPLAWGMSNTPVRHDLGSAPPAPLQTSIHATRPSASPTPPATMPATTPAQVQPALAPGPTLPDGGPAVPPTNPPPPLPPPAAPPTVVPPGPTSPPTTPGPPAKTPPASPSAPPSYPPSTPKPPPVALSLEAEGPSARWQGPSHQRKVRGASGGLVVGGRVGLPERVAVRFTDITVPQTRDYTVTFYYATPNARDASVWINGRLLMVIPLLRSKEIASVSVTARLTVGGNTIEFGNPTGPVIADLDRVVVTG